MTEEAKPRGRAVVEKATIQVLTLPDGSKRRVSSRPVGDAENIYNWIVELSGENPNRWYDLRDLYRFVYGGEPIKMNRSTTRTMRGFMKGARRYAIQNASGISVKTDSKGGVTHFKLLNQADTKEKKAAIENAAWDLQMEEAYDRRVAAQCETLDTSEEQLAAILKASP